LASRHGVRLSALRTSRTVVVSVSIAVAAAAGAVALVRFSSLPRSFDYAVWVAPLAVLTPYACVRADRRGYGLRTAAAALVVPTAATVWILWLLLIHAH